MDKILEDKIEELGRQEEQELSFSVERPPESKPKLSAPGFPVRWGGVLQSYWKSSLGRTWKWHGTQPKPLFQPSVL